MENGGVDEESEELFQARLKYGVVPCDAIAKSEDEKAIFLVLYRDTEKRTYSIKLDETGATSVKNWCKGYLDKKQTTLLGYG